ncbi:MAG: ATP-dependent RNA helicase RhlB, partial [Lysobacter sp.]
PTAPVEAELLVARPRPKREPAEGEEQESVGAIFKEAREQRAADEERRGGGRGRSGSGSGPGSSSSRNAGGRSEGGARGSRRPRRDGAPGSDTATPEESKGGSPVASPAASGARPQTAATATDGVPTGADGEAQRAPRKRRRRRGGRKIEGAGDTAASQSAQPQPTRSPAGSGKATQVAANKPKPVAKPADAKGGEKPGLLGRIKRGLQSMVTRGPNSQH